MWDLQYVYCISSNKHCVKSVQIQSYFWSVFSCIWTRKNSVFGHISRCEASGLKQAPPSNKHCTVSRANRPLLSAFVKVPHLKM